MQNEPQWCMGMIVTCGDGAKVACVNNNSVSVALDAGGIKSPHARIFPHALANLTQTPYSSRLTAR